jgi:hypothetical protein
LAGWREEGVIEYLGEVEDVRPVLADSGVFAADVPRGAAALDGRGDETVTDRINDALARRGAQSRERVLTRFSADRVNARILVVLRECE